MLSSRRTLIAILVIAPLLVQCVATEEEMRSMNLRFYTLTARLDTIESKSQKNFASLASDLDRIRNEFQGIKARLEEGTQLTQQLREEKKAVDARLAGRMQELEKEYQAKMRVLQQEMAKETQSVRLEVETLKKVKLSEAESRAREAADTADQARLSAVEASITREKAFHETEPPAIGPGGKKKKKDFTTEPGKENPKAGKNAPLKGDLYQQGVEHLRVRRLDDAFAAFSTFLGKNSGSPQEGDARFLLAEVLFEKKKYEDAILEYQKVLDKFPQHEKAPQAMLKQAKSFEQNKDSETATLIYRRLVENHPASPAAAEARSRLPQTKTTP